MRRGDRKAGARGTGRGTGRPPGTSRTKDAKPRRPAPAPRRVAGAAALRAVFEAMAEMTVLHEVVHDAAGAAVDYRIVDCNAAFTRVTGIPRERAAGALASELYGTGEAPYLATYARVAATGEPARFDAHFAPMDKHFSISVVSPARGAFVTVSTDVTDLRRAHDALARTQRLESLAVLAGGIAHDFNNLLTGVLGSLSLALLEELPQGPLREVLADAEKATRRARGLTQQLLTFSRGGAPLKEVTDLARTIREAALFCSRGSPVACRFDLARDLWPAEVDASQLAQVVQNIVLNAVQAMPRGGAVAVSARNVTLAPGNAQALPDGPYVAVAFEDSGPGIPADVLDRVFDPFFTTKRSGSGLGLAVSESIVRRHGGRLTASSRPGNGARFEAHLPARPGADVQAERPRAAAAPLRARVLVMDDEELVRRSAARMVTALGGEVMTARDGAEAVRLFADARAAGRAFDAVVLDLTVAGGMGGVEALARLRELDPAVRAVVSSGHSNDSAVAEHRALGFSGVLPKPYGTPELQAALAAVLTASRAP